MNRRSFVLSASMLAPFTGSKVMAQRGSRSAATILTSELTGGKVDISGTTLKFQNQHIDEADGSEHFHFAIGQVGLFDIYFWPQASGDAGEMTEVLADMLVASVPNAEMHASDAFEDGGFVAFGSGSYICYYEYQRNAYPDHDLLMLYHCKDNFEENFAATQSILIDGTSPFLFHEESGIAEIAASEMEKAQSGTVGTTSRTSRGRDTNENQETTNTRNSMETTPNATSESPIDAVNAHRESFWSSYSEFYDLLDIMDVDTATDKEIEDAWMQMLNIALVWQNYPTEAAEIEFGSEYASLESAYLDWADGIGLLGTTFEQYSYGEAEIDAFLNANDAITALDEGLQLELGGTTNSYNIKREPIALLQKRDTVKTIV